MDRYSEYSLAKRHRDGTFFICLGLFTAVVGTFGLSAALLNRASAETPAGD